MAINRKIADLSADFDVTGLRTSLAEIRGFARKVSAEMAKLDASTARLGGAAGTKELRKGLDGIAGSARGVERSIVRSSTNSRRGIAALTAETAKLGKSLTGSTMRRGLQTVQQLATSLGMKGVGLGSGIGLIGAALTGLGVKGVFGAAKSTNEGALKTAGEARAARLDTPTFSFLKELGKSQGVDEDVTSGALTEFAKVASTVRDESRDALKYAEAARKAAADNGAGLLEERQVFEDALNTYPLSDAGKAFKELGVKATDARGNLKPLVDLLREVGEAQGRSFSAKQLDGRSQQQFLDDQNSSIFGANAAAFSPVLDNIGRQGGASALSLPEGYRPTVVDEAQVQRAREWKAALDGVRQAIAQLRASMAQVMHTRIIAFFQLVTHILVNNQVAILTKVVKAWDWFFAKVVDLLLILSGQQAWHPENSWIYTFVKTVKLAVQAVKDFIAWLPTAIRFVKDAWFVITGQDARTSGQNPVLFELRDQVVNFGIWLALKLLAIASVILFYVGAALGHLNLLFLQFKLLWLDVQLAWATGNGDNAVTPIGRMIGDIREAIDWLAALKKSLVDVFVYDEKAQPGFEWVEKAKVAWDEFSAKLEKAWSWLKAIFGFWESIFAFFGVDLKTTLLFVGLLKMLGLLWMITLPLKLMGSLLLGFLSGLAQGLGAGAAGAAVAGAVKGGLAAMLTGIAGAITAFGSACLAIAPAVLQLALLAGVLFVAFKAGGEIGKGVAEWIHDFDGKIKGIADTMKANDEIYMRNKGLIDETGNYTDLARSQMRGIASSPAVANQTGSIGSNLPAVNLYLDPGSGDYPIQMYTQQSDLQRLLTSDQFSLTRP